MSVQQQFEAAVKVIQGLPKDGPYQPSISMMKEFYAYYKQATEGPCNLARPGFWDVIGRAKYDSWNALGDMTKEEAMAKYVEGLKKIIETMAYSTDVATFTRMLGPFYEYVSDLRPDAKAADANGSNEDNDNDSEEEVSDSGIDLSTRRPAESSIALAIGKYSPGGSDDEDATKTQSKPMTAASDTEEEEEEEEEEDVFMDPMEPEARTVSTSTSAGRLDTDTLAVMQHTVKMLNKDMEHVMARLRLVEDNLHQKSSSGSSWPGSELSRPTLMLLLVWPFVAHAIVAVATATKVDRNS